MIPYKDLNPSRRFPFVTVALIASNVAVFLYTLFLPEPMVASFIDRFAAIPLSFRIELNPKTVSTLVTSLFLHGGWFHLLGNMLYLWIFGDNVEEKMGPIRFLLFYLFTGIIATSAQILATPQSPLPTVGASGAIAGVLASYLRLFPRAQIAVLVPLLYLLRVAILPAWLVLGFWLLLQVAQIQWSHAAGEATGGIAYFAHLGGFLAGLIFMPLFKKKRGR